MLSAESGRLTADANRRIRVVAWPDWSDANPYQQLFYEALRPHGIEWLRDVPLRGDALFALDPPVDVLHIHWPYAYWRSRGASQLRQWRALARFRLVLRAARRRGIRVVWTVHDLEHLGGDRTVDSVGTRVVYRAADLVLHHTDWSAAEADARFGPPRLTTLVVPHGNYDGVFPEARPATETRAELGIPPRSRVLLCFGKLDEYKGPDLALEAFARLPDEDFHLVIAGEPRAGFVLDENALGRRNVSYLPGRLSDARLSDLLEASDGAFLPYRRVTTSGALMAALTRGRGVVATDLPPFREVVREASQASVLVPTGHVSALAEGVRSYFDVDPSVRGFNARALADRFEWARLVEPVAEWMQTTHAAGSDGARP